MPIAFQTLPNLIYLEIVRELREADPFFELKLCSISECATRRFCQVMQQGPPIRSMVVIDDAIGRRHQVRETRTPNDGPIITNAVYKFPLEKKPRSFAISDHVDDIVEDISRVDKTYIGILVKQNSSGHDLFDLESIKSFGNIVLKDPGMKEFYARHILDTVMNETNFQFIEITLPECPTPYIFYKFNGKEKTGLHSDEDPKTVAASSGARIVMTKAVIMNEKAFKLAVFEKGGVWKVSAERTK